MRRSWPVRFAVLSAVVGGLIGAGIFAGRRQIPEADPRQLEAEARELEGKILEKDDELLAAERAYGSALKIREALSPGSLLVAHDYYLLSKVAWKRGDLNRAENLLHSALEIQEAQAPESLETASSLDHLGIIALNRDELEGAESFMRRALHLREAIAPNSLDVAASLNNLGNVAATSGHPERAEVLFSQALELWDRLLPESGKVAMTLGNLGVVALQRGNLDAAERLYRRHISVLTKAGFDTNVARVGLAGLGKVALARGDLDAAEAFFRDALTRIHTVGPGTAAEAECLHDLGQVMWRKSQPAAAAEAFLQALDALESQAGRLGGSQEARSAYALGYQELYWDSQEILLELGRPEAAFAVLERSRARILLSMLAQRDLQLPDPDLPEPRPLDLAGVQAALEPGTLLLAYSVGAQKTYLYAVQRGHFEVHTLSIGADALQEEVASLCKLVSILPAGPRTLRALSKHSRRLHDTLLGPVQERISTCERLLLSPDGALHVLPFAALVQPDGRVLVESKPLHQILSGTLYGELRKSRPAAAGASRGLVAFGDPHYPAPGDPSSPARRHVMEPLPATRAEVEAIARLFGSGAVEYLGAEATEARAKSVGTTARYVHFACHGLLDERFPLDSALVLSVPEHADEGQDDGLLQAWEIFEKVRLDADLVTLSACETALGKQMGGEGLVGLSRAFQYAGARSVLASLWKVPDQSTAALMQRFYEGLRSGLSKDQALRAAQLDLLHRQGSSDPIHWAAFVLQGDRR